MTLLAVVLFVLASASGPGQEAFSEGHFDQALRQLDVALAQGLTGDARAQAELLRARCLAALQRTAEVDAAFEAALSDNPEAHLDPEEVAPALVARLETVRQTLRGTLRASGSTARPALLFVDGSARGSLPWAGDLPIGRHWLEVKGPAGEVWAAEPVVIHRGRLTEATLPVPPAPVQSSFVPWISGRALLDPRGGLSFEGGVGVALSWFTAEADLTVGAGLGATLRAGVRRARIVGPIGAQATVDGVLFARPVVAPGVGPTGEVFVSLPHSEVFVSVSGRWFTPQQGYATSYLLLGLGLRFLPLR
jgi:hypothetical protein